MRHMEVKYLWLQDVVRSGRIRKMRKVASEMNPADVLTKVHGKEKLEEAMKRVGGEYRGA